MATVGTAWESWALAELCLKQSANRRLDVHFLDVDGFNKNIIGEKDIEYRATE